MNITYINQIPELLQNLITIMLPNNNSKNSNSYYLRLLSDNLSKEYSLNEDSTLQIIQKDLTLSEASRIIQLHSRLLRLNVLNHRVDILYILSELKPDTSIAIPNTHLELFGESFNESFYSQSNLIDFKRDLIFAIQGIDSRNFTFSEQYECFSVNSAINTSMFSLSTKIAEIGWFYKKITGFIQKNINSMSSITMQSLAYSLKHEINKFYIFTAMLEQSSDKGTDKIKNIWASCDDVLENMKWLAILCDGVEGHKGCEIISAIYCYWRTGNESVKNLMKSILEEVSLPILEMIKNWMIEGELIDTFHEFFITINYTANKKKLWFEMFKINHEMVPCFFSQKLTQKILLTGKSLYFLRKACAEEGWSETIPEVESILDIEKAAWVTRIAQSTNEKLLNVLFGKYRLQEHCLSVKRYLLMSQGDFHHALMEGILPILNQHARKIYKHTLVSILETAIKSSNCQYHPLEFSDRVNVKLEEFKGSDLGWDIFSLDYSIGSPLDTFFTGEIMSIYRKIFTLLWKVKRAHYLINSLQHPHDLILLEDLRDFLPQLKITALLGNQISHFINILSNYLMVESIEAQWEKFYKNLTNAEDLDELIRIHNKFIQNIQEHCFISTESVNRQIIKILDIIIRYHNSREVFITSAKEELSIRKSPVAEIMAGDGVCRVSIESFADIFQISQIFTEEVIKFSVTLSKNDNLKLKNLNLILDFNEFYSYEILNRQGYNEEDPKYSQYNEVIQGLDSFSRKYK